MRPSVQLFVACFSLGMFALAACEAPRRAPEADAAATGPKPRPLTDAQRLNVLAAQVSAGQKSSEQAGCEYRYGVWDEGRKTCLDANDPSGRRTPPSPEAKVTPEGSSPSPSPSPTRR